MIRRQLADGRTVTARHNRGIRKRCGCQRSSWARCAHPWHGNYSFQGVEHRVSLHKWAKKPAEYVMLQGEAKTLYRQWTTAIDGGEETPQANTSELTLAAIADIYLHDYVHHPDRRLGAAKEMARQVETLRAVFGPLLMVTITKPMIEQWRLERRQAHEAGKAAIERLAALRAAPAVDIPHELLAQAQRAMVSTKAGRVATNRLLARLRHLFSWAIAERELLESSPFSKAGKTVIKLDTKVEDGRTRRLEGDEEIRLVKMAGPHLRACIEATLETGMRRGEVLGLEWRHVRRDAGVIDLPASLTKTGVERQVVITPRLDAILDMRAATQRLTRELPPDATLPADTHPFGNELGERVQSFKTAWRLTCRRAGISGLHFHDLRREAGSQLLESGASLTDVRDYLGHTSVTQTNTYLSSSLQRRRDALAKRDAARTNLAQPPAATEQADAPVTVTH